jgi:uncharacterized repeat protein (TIGR03833 family)
MELLSGNNRSNIKPGQRVFIVLKADQRSGKLTEGIVKEILTPSAVHPHGIKVRLQSGMVGRVKEIKSWNLKRYVALAKIVLDLHDIFNKGRSIDTELNRVMAEAVDKKIALVEIIPGKGSGQLKKRVLRFLQQPEIKQLYHRVEKDDKNFGRIFVHFKP